MSAGLCVCGKRIHRSRQAARREARRIHPGERLDTYHCPMQPDSTPVWHYGHYMAGIRSKS